MLLYTTGQNSFKVKNTYITGLNLSRGFVTPFIGTSFPKRTMSELPSNDYKLSQFRNFSTEEKIPPLSNVIERELKDENDFEICPMPKHLSELHTDISKSWSINVEDSSRSSAIVKLLRNDSMDGGGIVSLYFHCQDTIDYDNSIYDSDDNQDENNINDQEGSASVRFDIFVSRNGKTMKLTCTTHDSEVSVDSVVVFNGDVDNADDDKDPYRGPNLDELPEDMQEGFSHYVIEECGVDEHVAAFISMFSDFQEQKQYIQWLKDVKMIIDS